MSTDTDATGPSAGRPMPPLVYVPTTGGPDVRERRVIFHELLDGRTALLVYSALDRLQRFYRADSHWTVCDVAGLQSIHDDVAYDALFVDHDAGLDADAPDALARAVARAEGV